MNLLSNTAKRTASACVRVFTLTAATFCMGLVAQAATISVDLSGTIISGADYRSIQSGDDSLNLFGGGNLVGSTASINITYDTTGWYDNNGDPIHDFFMNPGTTMTQSVTVNGQTQNYSSQNSVLEFLDQKFLRFYVGPETSIYNTTPMTFANISDPSAVQAYIAGATGTGYANSQIEVNFGSELLLLSNLSATAADTSAPEPSTLGLMMFSGIGLVAAARRGRKSV